jgi:hypothetical protein
MIPADHYGKITERFSRHCALRYGGRLREINPKIPLFDYT